MRGTPRAPARRSARGELGLEPGIQLDRGAREVVIEGVRTSLAPLEFGVLQTLNEAGGRALSRRELLEAVWETNYTGGSNVVDAVVHSLRDKLGLHGAAVETVRGVGYRLRAPRPTGSSPCGRGSSSSPHRAVIQPGRGRSNVRAMTSGQHPGTVVRRYVDEVLSGRDPHSIVTNLLVAQGDLVAVNLRGRGTHLGTFQGVLPSGRRWAATCSAFYRVGDGRIEDFWENWDLLGILEQIGASRRSELASA